MLKAFLVLVAGLLVTSASIVLYEPGPGVIICFSDLLTPKVATFFGFVGV